MSNADHKDSGDSQNADTHGGGDKDDSMTSIIPEKGEPTGVRYHYRSIINTGVLEHSPCVEGRFITAAIRFPIRHCL